MPIPGGGITVLSIHDEARNLYLNDASASLFTDAVLLPIMKAVWQELEDELIQHGISYILEESTAKTITAGTLVYSPLPSDMLEPTWMGERTSGSTGDYIPMDQKTYVPDEQQTSSLNYWCWREGVISFVGATVDVQVLLRYKKALSEIVSTSTVITVPGAKTFLAQRLAQRAARHIGGNKELSAELKDDAEEAKNRLLVSLVKNMQNMGVRPRPFKAFRSRR